VLWFSIGLWPIMCVKSVTSAIWPAPPALVAEGILLILITAILLTMLWWSSSNSVNAQKRQMGHLVQVTIGSSGALVVGGIHIIIGLLTSNMLNVDPNTGTYVLSRTAEIIIAIVALPGFWLLVVFCYVFWFGAKLRYFNDRVENGFLIRYKPLRLEAFTDGVVAIAVTLLAIEFPAPLDINAAEFLNRMEDVAMYGITFSILFVHWYLHYRMVHWIRTVDLLLFWVNVVFCYFMTMSPVAIKLLEMASEFNTTTQYFSTAHNYCFIIFSGIGIMQIIECIYILKREALHKPGHAVSPRLTRLIIFGCAATPVAAVLVRLIAFSGWSGSIYFYYMSPVINICLYAFLSGGDPKDHDMDPHHSLSYHKMGDATDKTIPLSERAH